MAKALVGALALALLPEALAFRNTSPFFLYSTSELLAGNDETFARSTDISNQVLETLEDCPSDYYFVVRQAGVSSADYVDRFPMQSLAADVSGKNKDIRSSKAVSEVFGEVSVDAISQHLLKHCDAEQITIDVPVSFDSETKDAEITRIRGAMRGGERKPKVFSISLPAPQAHREEDMETYDNFLTDLIETRLYEKYTVIYTTNPPASPEPPAYEMDDTTDTNFNTELKRDTTFVKRAENATQEGGLFERYQYFTPGLFMAFAAMIPLVVILGVGLKAIASIEVSYFAFSKEMGPAAQRKQ